MPKHDLDEDPSIIGDEADGYQVGYGRPPRHSQFKPGQSGNPRGRPRRPKTVSQMLRETVSRPITLTENGRKKTVTWLEALFMQTAKAALQGDTKATDRMMRLLPAIQAAFAEDSAAGGANSAGARSSNETDRSAFGSHTDRELLAFFADQVARGELSFADPAASTAETSEGTTP